MVKQKHLIVCEGVNDKKFLEAFIKNLNILNIEVTFIKKDAKNKSSLFQREKYDSIKNEIGFLYKNILFVFDSDYEKNDKKYGGYNNSEKEIKQLIKDLNFNNYADYYIVCDPITKEGYLESFILSTIENEQKKCIEYFLNCSEFKNKEHHKAIFNEIYKLGYPNAPYNFEHKNFDELKDKIKKLIED